MNSPRIRTLIVGMAIYWKHFAVLRQTRVYQVLGIVSDQSRWWGRGFTASGVRRQKKLPHLIEKFDVSSCGDGAASGGAVLGELIALCHAHGAPKVSFKLVPSLQEVLNSSTPAGGRRVEPPTCSIGRSSIGQLVGSEPPRCPHPGHGSGRPTIGSELCAQVARYAPSQLIALESNANSLFYLERE